MYRVCVFPPSDEGIEYLREIFSSFGERVRVSHGIGLVRRPHDDPGFLQALEAVGQDVRWDSFRRIEQPAVGTLAAQQIAYHQQRPFVANPLQGIGDGTR